MQALFQQTPAVDCATGFVAIAGPSCGVGLRVEPCPGKTANLTAVCDQSAEVAN